MPIFRRRTLTDDEFVERLRHMERKSRKPAIFFSIVLSVIAVCLLKLAYSGYTSFANESDSSRGGYKLGLFIGGAIGYFFVTSIMSLVNALITAFAPGPFRIHRLLIKYYDLAGRAKNESAADNPATDDSPR